MTTIFTRPTIIYPSLAVLVLAILFPQLYILQALIYTPLYISSTFFFLITYILYRAIKSDRQPSTPSTSSAVRTKHALRQLRFTTPAAWSAVLTRQSWEDKPSPFIPIHKNATTEVNSRLDSFLGLIRLHFILPWYNQISPSPAFPHAVESLVRHILSDLTGRAEDVDWPDMMVLKVLPIVSDHFQHYRSIEHLSSSSSAPSPNPALPLPLPRRVHPALSSHSHTSSGTSPSIEAHLRETLARVLDRSLPEKDKSEVVLTIVREIVLGAVLLPVFDMLCDPDFWNRQIDEKGGRYLHEQKQVDKFLSALSALPAPTASANNTPLPSSKSRKNHKTPATPSSTSISSESSSKQFDNFLRSIGKLKTLGDARRLRSDVERELRSAKLALADELRQGQSSKEGDKKLKRAEKYVQRLERAKVDIDRKVEILSGQPGKPPRSLERSPMSSMILEAASTETVTLYSILSDPSSLAYWLEHMERRGRSRLVQYWLTVEGFKDPLEAAGLNSALDSTSQPNVQLASSGSNDTVGEDVAFLYEMYFAAGQTGINIPSKHRQVIEETAQLSSTSLSSSDAQKVKHAVFASQKDIYEQMAEEDWPAFKKSELYIKALSDLKRAGVSLAPLTVAAEPQQISSPKLGSTPLPRTPIVRPPATPNESSRSLLDILSPSARPRQTNKRGSFSPARPPTPTASVSITPPLFQRSMTSDTHIPLFRDVRRVSPGTTESKFSSLESSVPTTPPPPVRRSSHLDFLISGGESKEDIPDNRDKLFGDDEDIDEDDEAYVEAQRIEAIQAALNEIIASDDMASSKVIDLTNDDHFTSQPKSPSASLILFDKTPKIEDKISKLTSRSAENLKSSKNSQVASSAPQSRLPSVALPDVRPIPRRRSIPRLSLSPEKSSKHLFDDELIDEDEVLIDEEELDNNANDVIQLAAPGDLQLSVEISRLQDKIQELVQQDHLLDTLIRQAELTGNQVELRILRRSQSSVRREQRTAIFQKAQFEQQEEENRLIPGRTKVTIPSSVVASEHGENGKQVVRYTIEVSQVDEDGKIRLGWVVARRYNEFYELDKALKDWAMERHDLVEELKSRLVEMPGKRLVPNLSASFVESRRAGLERYLQSLLTSSIICDSPLLRAFLSRSPVPLKPGSGIDPMSSSTASLASLAPHNIVKSLYKTMATSLDDALLGPSMLDMMYTTLSRQLVDFGGLVGLGGDDLNDPIAAVGAGQGQGRIGPMGGESGMTSFTGPICDLFIEVFDLKENNWLRRQAIVVILQQFLGSTIERKVRDSFRSATSSESLERLISNLQENLFPDGERRSPSVVRTEQEKLDTRLRAGKKLGMLIPDVAANMIGRSNARRAARRVFGALQDTRLNQHLILSIMDEVSE
uniref:PXA domain-containing protein n=1 Tax=Kwoniella bestiolae CBS 10118 TaxID=1296100 RepID=A0A1B9GB69_9TREE|nr:hypothetical protein I302_03111 [Kwoniella bestiolae CBS 10118]OCF28259.1 hypothetical protein I302_03111 [Kwoniella bestiolae CBS 10118]